MLKIRVTDTNLKKDRRNRYFAKGISMNEIPGIGVYIYGENENLKVGETIETDKFDYSAGKYPFPAAYFVTASKQAEPPKEKIEEPPKEQETLFTVRDTENHFYNIKETYDIDDLIVAKYVNQSREGWLILSKNKNYIFSIVTDNREYVVDLVDKINPQLIKLFNSMPENAAMKTNMFGKRFNHFFICYELDKKYYVKWEDKPEKEFYRFIDAQNAITYRSEYDDIEVELKIPLSKIDYLTNDIRILSEHIEVVKGELPKPFAGLKISYWTVSNKNKELADVICTKSINNIKRNFTGFLYISGLVEIGAYGPKRVKTISEIKVDDETFAMLKKIVSIAQINLELKRALQEARAAKDFYNRDRLIKALLAAGKTVTKEEVEAVVDKHFNRKKYDENFFNVLKTATNDENIYMSENSFVFVQKGDDVNWRIVETPGISAATYIFSDKQPLPEFLMFFESTPKSVFFNVHNTESEDDTPEKRAARTLALKVRQESGFVTKVSHTIGWANQIEEVLKKKDALTPLMSDSLAVLANAVKKNAPKQRTQIESVDTPFTLIIS